MTVYRKKPVEIEAYQWEESSADIHNYRKLPLWIQEAYEYGDLLIRPDGVRINTLEGWMTGSINDYIIRGIRGELYPCKPDIFLETYDLVG